MTFNILTVALATPLAIMGAAFAAPASIGEARDQAAKPTIVLVHGAFADATGWQHNPDNGATCPETVTVKLKKLDPHSPEVIDAAVEMIRQMTPEEAMAFLTYRYD